MLINFFLISLSLSGKPTAVESDINLALYYSWLGKESHDSVYLKAYQRYKEGKMTSDTVAVQSALSNREQALELETLSEAFTEAFWLKKDYDRAFYIGFQLEEKLPQVSETDYPGKREVYYKLGEAYYLFLDFYKSIELLEKALAPTPLTFDNTVNLDALNILGICYANINQWQKSNDYFRATLQSDDIVLRRPLYNTYAISHLGCNEMQQGNYDKAIAFSKAVWPTLRKETNDYGHLAGMCYCRGRSYLQKGDFKQAQAWVDSLVYFARKDTYNPTKRIKQAYQLQADYYTAMGNALQAKVYNDSLVGIYKMSEQEYTSGYIARAAQMFNDEKIEAQKAELRISHARVVATSIIALLGIIAVIVISSLYRKKNAAYKALAHKASEWAHRGENSYITTTLENAVGQNQNEPLTEEEAKIMSLIEREMITNYAYREVGLTTESLAKRLDIHRNTLSKVINKSTKENFNHYVNSFRIREAVRIISGTSHRELYIDELFERVGFGNRSTFYRIFKQFTGLSPIEFQKQQGYAAEKNNS